MIIHDLSLAKACANFEIILSKIKILTQKNANTMPNLLITQWRRMLQILLERLLKKGFLVIILLSDLLVQMSSCDHFSMRSEYGKCLLVIIFPLDLIRENASL